MGGGLPAVDTIAQAIHLIYEQIVIPHAIKAAVDEAVKAALGGEPLQAEIQRLMEENQELTKQVEKLTVTAKPPTKARSTAAPSEKGKPTGPRSPVTAMRAVKKAKKATTKR